MPLYDYKCTLCGKVTEVRHGFNESHAAPCPACGGALSRVFNPAPIVFKGSGFYVTDSRKKPASSPASGEPSKASSGTTASDAKPAEPAAPAKSDAKAADSAA